MIIANKYKIIERVGSGAFSEIYKGENIRTKELVAIKVEPLNNGTKMLKHETKIYQYLCDTIHIPLLKWFGHDDINYYMVLTLLGDSLVTIKNNNKGLILKSIIHISIQIINLLKGLHEKGLIHRDVKPDNFLFGLDSSNASPIYLIDFGFTKKYRKKDGKTHINMITNKTLIGTPNFVSINIHNGLEPSRRDDLESVGYIMIYLFTNDSFSSIINDHESIKLFKMNIDNNMHIPEVIKIFLQYCRQLTFEETPKYDYLIKILMLALHDHVDV